MSLCKCLQARRKDLAAYLLAAAVIGGIALIYPVGNVLQHRWWWERGIMVDEPGVFFAFGLVLVIGLGPWVRALLEWAHSDVKAIRSVLSRNDWEDWGRDWERATQLSVGGGKWVGLFERLLFFFAILAASYLTGLAIGGWLTFKLGSKWQVWNQIVKVPTTIERGASRTNLGEGNLTALALRHAWGSRLYGRFILGALANVAAGAVGVLGGIWIEEHVPTDPWWLC